MVEPHAPVQVVQDHAEEVLEKMHSKGLVPQLKALELFTKVKCDILRSDSKEETNAHLLSHLKKDADEEAVGGVFRIASEKTGYEKMKVLAASVLRELQRVCTSLCTGVCTLTYLSMYSTCSYVCKQTRVHCVSLLSLLGHTVIHVATCWYQFAFVLQGQPPRGYQGHQEG